MAKILVVDDAKFSRNRLSEPLEEAGFEVITAQNGEEGLRVFEEYQPECIITDLLMPVMDGVEMIRRLRAEGSEVPVIVVTADIQATTRKKCEALGISEFMTKPFQPQELLNQVQQVMATATGVRS